LPLATIAALGSTAALLLALFVGRAGSQTALLAALALAAALAGVAAALALRNRRSRRRDESPAVVVPAPRSGGAEWKDRPRSAPPASPADPTNDAGHVDHDGGGVRDGSSGTSAVGHVTDSLDASSISEAPEGVSARAASLARRLADEARRRLGAPAAAVLVPVERRLKAAGSAGDWKLARRLQAETEESVPTGVPTVAGDAPPEFLLDQHLPLLLALYPKAMPVERWQELSDVPGFLLPLAALGASGAGAAVSLGHRGRLAGLGVVARRPAGRAFTNQELSTLERLARAAAPDLARALLADEGRKTKDESR
jgi:hypothetical protein